MVLPTFFLTFNFPLLTFYYSTFYHTILYLCIKKIAAALLIFIY